MYYVVVRADPGIYVHTFGRHTMNASISLPGISPSVLSADFCKLESEVKSVKNGGADGIHVDVMDGHYVPNITCGPMFVQAVRKSTDLPIDTHLMVTNPGMFIESMIKAGSNFVTVHVEACQDLNRCVSMIRDLGACPGVAINPSTPLISLEYIIDYIDLVLVMGVDPGFGGQKFISNITGKVHDLKKMIEWRGLDVIIELDGGVNVDTVGDIAAAGVDLFVAGSAIFDKEDRKAAITELRRIISEAKGETIPA